jgi:hypothetical protein
LAHSDSFDEFSKPKKSNTGKFILVGCLAIIIATLLLVGVGGIFVWQNWRGWASTAFVETADAVFEEFHLPDEEADALMQRVTMLADEFEAENISLKELQTLAEAITDSDLMPMLITKAMYGGYIVPSSLSDEDKARGELAFGRLARGFVDDKLVDDDIEAVLQPLNKDANVSITVDGDGVQTSKNFNIKSPREASAKELLEVIANAEKLAEEKGLDPEPLDVDVVAELDELISETLGRNLEPGGE